MMATEWTEFLLGDDYYQENSKPTNVTGVKQAEKTRSRVSSVKRKSKYKHGEAKEELSRDDLIHTLSSQQKAALDCAKRSAADGGALKRLTKAERAYVLYGNSKTDYSRAKDKLDKKKVNASNSYGR